MPSNYSSERRGWNSMSGETDVRYVKCNACFGSGEDRHGYGDCIECDGYGDVEARY